jgi:hypothetical protein
MLKAWCRKVGRVGFVCPWCGCWHRINLYQRKDEASDDYCEVLEGPPANRLLCSCGADLLVLGVPSDFEVVWLNEKGVRLKAWLKLKPKLRPGDGGYYDLVRVPHGHVPVGKVWLWRRLPIPVREIRGDRYFRCPECGRQGFFKQMRSCMLCRCRLSELRYSFPEEWVKASSSRALRVLKRERQDYFRGLLKRLECLVLPVLVLAGQAWYVRSERGHWSDR